MYQYVEMGEVDTTELRPGMLIHLPNVGAVVTVIEVAGLSNTIGAMTYRHHEYGHVSPENRTYYLSSADTFEQVWVESDVPVRSI